MKITDKMTDDEILANLGERMEKSLFSLRWFSPIKNPVRRVKLYLQFSFGDLYSGEENERWTRSAKDVIKLGGK